MKTCTWEYIVMLCLKPNVRLCGVDFTVKCDRCGCLKLALDHLPLLTWIIFNVLYEHGLFFSWLDTLKYHWIWSGVRAAVLWYIFDCTAVFRWMKGCMWTVARAYPRHVGRIFGQSRATYCCWTAWSVCFAGTMVLATYTVLLHHGLIIGEFLHHGGSVR